MRVCRFDTDKLGLVEGEQLVDATAFLDTLEPRRWVFPLADPVVANLDALRGFARNSLAGAPRLALDSVRLEAPVPRPSKIIGAPVNFHAHLDEARADRDLHQGRHVHPIDEIGLFLKATSALVGPGGPITLCQPERRSDYEAEVAVIVGRTTRGVRSEDALEYVGGYALALDLSIRGKEDRSMRKSPDGYAVLGPCLVTPEEVGDVEDIKFVLTVNGHERQRGSTALLIRKVPELIEMASRFYTLHPGDIIMTGTPAGVGALAPGDRLRLSSEVLGVLEVDIDFAPTGR